VRFELQIFASIILMGDLQNQEKEHRQNYVCHPHRSSVVMRIASELASLLKQYSLAYYHPSDLPDEKPAHREIAH